MKNIIPIAFIILIIMLGTSYWLLGQVSTKTYEVSTYLSGENNIDIVVRQDSGEFVIGSADSPIVNTDIEYVKTAPHFESDMGVLNIICNACDIHSVIPNNVIGSIIAEADAGNFDMDLRETNIHHVKMNVGAGNIITSPPVGSDSQVELIVGAGNITLYKSSRLGGIRIAPAEGTTLNFNDYANNYDLVDNGYQTKGFTKATNVSIITIGLGAGNLQIKDTN